MLRLPLRGKILLYSASLVVVLIVAMLIFINYQAQGFVNDRINSELVQGQARILRAEQDRLEGLTLSARLVASFPELKALLATDRATIRDFLLSYQQENQRSELLIVLDPAGRVLTRTDTEASTPLPEAESRWVPGALSGTAATGILVTESGVYHVACAPAAAGGTVFGFVLAGARVDDSLAMMLRDLSQNEIVLAGDALLGSTLERSRLPWQRRQQWEGLVGESQPARLEMGDERYAGLMASFDGASKTPVRVVMLQSLDQALAPYRRIRLGLLVLGSIVILAGVAASGLLARSVTAPVAKLVDGTREVSAGNFDFRLDIRSGDEIGDLAQSFNSMIQGLRERADMQKFVSRSTMEMIQDRLGKNLAEGERVLLTVFFSDMRGFTSLSEEMSPPDVVKMLNESLGIQAALVEKFEGDVDKFVGDAVVAIFSGDDMALNAVLCAMEIQKAIAASNAASAREKPLEVGIGIVTGDVLLGSIGSKDRLDFTVIGANVNLCARFCSVAAPGEVLVDELTFHLLQGRIPTERLEPVQLKGFAQPVPVYRIRFASDVGAGKSLAAPTSSELPPLDSIPHS